MKKSLTAVCTALALLAFGALPGAAGTADDPEITDPAGDANFLSPITGIEEDTRPASLDNADLRAVWFETAYDANKILDPETGEILRVEYVPTDLVVKIQTQDPVRPLTPWNSLRFRVHATVPECQASFELLVATNPASDRAEIRRAVSGAMCGELAPSELVLSPVTPTFDGTASTMVFPLAHEGVSKVISPGMVLSQTSAHAIAGTGVASPPPVDDTAVGRNFTIGQDVPPDVDCTADPDHAECQS